MRNDSGVPTQSGKQLILVLILGLVCLLVGTVILVSCTQAPRKQPTESPPLQRESNKPEVSVQEKQLTESPPLQREPDKPEVIIQEKKSIEPPSLPSESDKPEIFAQLGHSAPIQSIALSPDGKYVLSGSEDNTLKLWEIATGREIRTFKGHSDEVWTVAYSPNGKYALSGSEDHTLKLWEIATGEEIRTFKGHAHNVDSVVFTPDGKYVLSGSTDSTLKLWEIVTGKEIRTFKGHSGSVNSVAFSPDGKYALSGSNDNTIKLWEVATGEATATEGSPVRGAESRPKRDKEIRSFKGHSKDVESVAFSPDGKYALSGSGDKTIKLWNITSGKAIRTFQGHSGWVKSVAFSPDGKYALSGSADMTLKLWEVTTGKEIRTFYAHNNSVESVAFSPDGKYVLSGSYDGTIRLWETMTVRQIRIFEGVTNKVSAVALSPDGKYALSGNFWCKSPNLLRLWDLTTGRQIKTLKGHKTSAIAFSPNGKYAISASSSKVKLWEIATGKEIGTFEGHSGSVEAVAFSPDGKYALAGYYDKILKLWEVATGKEIRTFEGHSERVWTVTFSPDGQYALSGGYDNTLKLWEVATGKEIRTFKGHSHWIDSVAFSPDGKYALSGSWAWGTNLRLWEVATGKQIKMLKGHPNHVTSVAFSPDGKYALSGSKDNTLKLWEIESANEIRTFKGHSGWVHSVAFSPDGRYALSGSKDGTIRLWDVATGKEIAQMVVLKDGGWICVTPEGYFNTSEDGAKYLNVSIGTNVYSIDQFFERFYNPAIVAQVISGKKVELTENIQKGFKTPPDVTIISPKSGHVFNKEEIEIVVQTKDTGGGISEIRLYHNGSAIGEGRRGIKIVESTPSIVKKTYRVILIDGENIFRAVGFSKDRTESNPYELIVRLTAPAKEVALHLLVVGINKYKNSNLNLNFAEPDARAIKDFFIQKGKTLFKEVNIIELYNESATRKNILAKLEALQTQPSRLGRDSAVAPQDVVIIYLAGHGMNLEDKWYFIPYEVVYPERDEEVKAKGIASGELGEKIKNIVALKKLVLIDACKSGKVLLAFARGLEDRRVLAQLARATGVHIIAASSQDQIATEVKELGHGVFTYTLLEGLRGKAKLMGNKVTVRGLLTYVEERLPEVSKKYRREAQFPVSDSRGMDFPLILVK